MGFYFFVGHNCGSRRISSHSSTKLEPRPGFSDSHIDSKVTVFSDAKFLAMVYLMPDVALAARRELGRHDEAVVIHSDVQFPPVSVLYSRLTRLDLCVAMASPPSMNDRDPEGC